ncbi:leucine-rich repeat-containing protein 63 isoform X2 [Puntigrus tetrazona]|uniref:leucine-rich repeat-containing protein 63 isoform X2 n=1 Tax=Puntigrus tetrazona TaxID=1606681 RepID=UPI001C8A492B|nr:leucine-rich repeat-containing protein 63 isoform X2 [Puntigrus tetrazona]
MEHVKLLRRPLPPKKTAHYRTPRAAGSDVFSVDPGHDEARESVCEDDEAASSSHHPQRSSPVPPRPRPPDLFCLDDFLQASGSEDQLRRTVLSRWNYRKLLRLFLSELHRGGQEAVANQTLSGEGLSPPTRRIPHRQVVCELAAMVQKEARAQNSFRNHPGVCRASEDQSVERRTEHTRQDLYTVLLNSVTSKHFQDSRRSRSPFHRDFISASELSVLDCATRGGNTLSFKAHFIADLPDVSSLSERLQHLNLSFNHFTHVPLEVCDLHQLQVLKMRNNPIEEIPARICKLCKLQTLVISFCKITQLPDQLYSLACLQHLDVSYNLLRSLSSEVKHLRSLRSLNVEGNQLVALPAGLLRVSVSELRMSGNYTHVFLWSENSCNSPQTLLHTAAHTLTQQHYTHLPPAARILLNSAGVCDACNGVMFGAGLKLIRPAPGGFGLPIVPVMFFCCSPACLHRFRNQPITV